MAQTAPSREVKLTFAQIAPPPGSMALRGVNPNGGIEFGMRSDEVASKAVLNLEYTPSPSRSLKKRWRWRRTAAAAISGRVC